MTAPTSASNMSTRHSTSLSRTNAQKISWTSKDWMCVFPLHQGMIQLGLSSLNHGNDVYYPRNYIMYPTDSRIWMCIQQNPAKVEWTTRSRPCSPIYLLRQVFPPLFSFLGTYLRRLICVIHSITSLQRCFISLNSCSMLECDSPVNEHLKVLSFFA